MKSPAHRSVEIDALRDAGNVHRADAIAVEEPLEIRLLKDGAARRDDNGGTGRPVSITMRTPGNDAELALGFLYGEGMLREPRDVVDVRPCGPTGNVMRVTVRADLPLDLDRLERNFYTTSSCGVCGKASIEAVTASAGIRARDSDLVVRESVLRGLPDTLKASQRDSRRPAACMRSDCSPPRANSSPAAKTWAATTPWTSWWAQRC